MKTRKTPAKPARRPPPGQAHPLGAQLLLYREALRRIREKAAKDPASVLPIDEELRSES